MTRRPDSPSSRCDRRACLLVHSCAPQFSVGSQCVGTGLSVLLRARLDFFALPRAKRIHRRRRWAARHPAARAIPSMRRCRRASPPGCTTRPSPRIRDRGCASRARPRQWRPTKWCHRGGRRRPPPRSAFPSLSGFAGDAGDARNIVCLIVLASSVVLMAAVITSAGSAPRATRLRRLPVPEHSRPEPTLRRGCPHSGRVVHPAFWSTNGPFSDFPPRELSSLSGGIRPDTEVGPLYVL